MAKPITNHYVYRKKRRAAKALHGNLNLFKGFVDVKGTKDRHNPPF